ncbi:hypothetical protein GCM10010869_71680 [Mesorhizobium tianshanense]|uniref:Uncharacterized protein n=1 Tax=Mesorhizobium tianshanense TaxID=39844 RepID=A0A562P3V5_9HYPH|nr:hypothetical protein [Mesorhizobium tianshanense]TWI39134.1 hypothetical protein IQ26_01983 [Mesorhizobium tianshanense]GLS41571.1 hypothetical protein GCM10010869_71680 [Mesorhizobium tianshanense]
MSDWLSFEDAVALVSVRRNLSHVDAGNHLRAAIAIGEIEVRNLRHLVTDFVPSHNGNEDREVSRRALIKWLEAQSVPVADTSLEDIYLSPFMQMMLDAVRHFKISDTPNPRLRKEEIKEYFVGRRLPNGQAISPNQAESMATFVRSPDAMKGGNKRVG